MPVLTLKQIDGLADTLLESAFAPQEVFSAIVALWEALDIGGDPAPRDMIAERVAASRLAT